MKSATDFAGSFSAYNYQIAVDYVESGALDTPVVGPTDFKRMRVIVTRDGMTDFNVSLSTIIANLGN